MKILLLEDVDQLGTKDEIVEVKDGFARNYLIPKGLAVPASGGIVADAKRRKQAKKQSQLREEAQVRELAEELDASTVSIEAKASAEERLFGSITSGNIAEAVQEQLNVSIDKRRIQLDQPIKALGEHEVKLKLGSGQTAVIKVIVKPIEGDD